MRQSIATLMFLGFVTSACAGAPPRATPESRDEAQQLITLFKENRTKFVEQKQSLASGADCGHATQLRVAIDELAHEAGMNPENTDDVKKVQMELHEAEKTCQSK